MTEEVQRSEYKYRLHHCGGSGEVRLRAAFEFLKVFPLWRDSGAMMIDHAAYMKMVDAGEIPPPVSWWQIKEGQFGFVVLEEYRSRYGQTWEKISTACQDFKDGWTTCLKSLGNDYDSLQAIQREYGVYKAKEAIKHCQTAIRRAKREEQRNRWGY